MPVQINVGLSRKESKDYNSKGYTLNIEAELPASVINDPNAVADAANRLYQLADDIIEERIRMDRGEHLAKPVNHDASPTQATKPAAPSPVAAPVKAQSPAASTPPAPAARQAANGRGITQAQIKAIHAIAKRLDENPDTAAFDEFGSPVNQLTIRQASELIDLLKSRSTSPAGARR